MGLRKARPLTLKPRGCSDSIDGTNTFSGGMASLQNLIPNPSTDRTWVPRPASTQLSEFPGFSTPGFVSAYLVVGDIAYGMIASALHAGKDQPFAYNLRTNTFLTITGITAANVPASPAATGDWSPPIMAVVGSRVVVTHPGFAGGSPGFFFGWFDISGFSDATHTGSTHTTTTVDTLSANVLQAGWNVGMTISSSAGDIPAGTTIKSIASNGLSLVLSAAATGSNAGATLTVTGGTAASPQWGAGNTNGNALASVPIGVSQMAGRAYFAVGFGVVLSDSANATQVTNATQVLLFNNGLTVTALGQLPLTSPLTGGIIQAIIAFQGVAAMQIITGDPATTNLAVNLLKAGTGTLAPLSICPSNDGLAFISPEGLRFISFAGTVSPPVGDHGSGIAVPFIYAINPSRICAASNADTLRISVQNGFAAGQPQQEWWYDLTRKVFHGPHSFPASLIQPWGATFTLIANGINAKIWQSDPTPSTGSTYTENGAVMTWVFQPSLFPDLDDAKMHAIVESTWATQFPPQLQATAQFLDESASVLDTVFLAGSGTAASTWGVFVWGIDPWLGGAGFFLQRRFDWHFPLIFKQASLRITGNSLNGLVLGDLFLKYQELGYMLAAVS